MAAYLGYATVPTVAGPVELEWSLDALADLDRFATFLHGQFPDLATRVANELIVRADVLRRHPKLADRSQPAKSIVKVVLQVLGGCCACFTAARLGDGRSQVRQPAKAGE